MPSVETPLSTPPSVAALGTTRVGGTSRRATLLALPLAAFLIVTSETLPVGLLGQIAAGLHVPTTSVGLLTGGYALVAALTPVPLVRLTARYDRRAVLSAAVGLFVVGNAVAAGAPNLAVLFAARGFTAVAQGLFFSIAGPVAARMAPAARQGQWAGTVMVGATAAFVLGVPLATAVGQLAGWRVATALVAVLGAALLVPCRRALPALPAPADGDGAAAGGLGTVLRSRSLLTLFAITFVLVVAHFDGFTYLEPYLQRRAHLTGATFTLALGLYGISAVAGSLLGGQLADRFPRAAVLTGVPVLALALLALQAGPGTGRWLVLCSLALWGGAFALVALSTQLAVLRRAGGGPAAETASAVHGAVFQIGIAAGSGVASLLVGHGGLRLLPVTGAGVAVVGLVLCLAGASAFVPRLPAAAGG